MRLWELFSDLDKKSPPVVDNQPGQSCLENPLIQRSKSAVTVKEAEALLYRAREKYAPVVRRPASN